MIPVILSGGSGTRLWPVSRTKYPKQFADLFDESLLSKTLKRLKVLGEPWTITTKELKTLTERTYGDMELPLNVIYEPFGRNTAPAIAAFCHVMNLKGQSEQVAGVFPADHFIENEKLYTEALTLAEDVAQNGEIVTIGIRPSFPATGYGYIETTQDVVGKSVHLSALRASGFREKPDLKTAEQFVQSGRFNWNAGMFVFKISHMSSLFEKHLPQMWSLIRELKPDLSNVEDVYKRVESISVDYGIMEKLKSHVCIACDVGWNDVGSWDEVSKIKESTGEKIEIGSSGNFVFGSEEKTYAFVDVSNVMLVETSDAILVAKKESSQKVKEVVDKLKATGRAQDKRLLEERNFELRPWGRFEILRDTDAFKSKVIHVNPGHQLSYQSHAKRAEHWVVIKGYPEVVLNDKVYNLKPGESIYIPQGAKHRMRNTGQEVVEFVEVQVGSYFGEDDIVRYQDDYNR